MQINKEDFNLPIGKVESILCQRRCENIKAHTLRYWCSFFEHIPFIKLNGRRYFSSSSVEEFYKIYTLSKIGHTLNGIKNRIKYNKITTINQDYQKTEHQEDNHSNESHKDINNVI